MRSELEKISEIRVRNNTLWMSILDIALRKDPEATKAILMEIRNNDRLITRQESAIVEGWYDENSQ